MTNQRIIGVVLFIAGMGLLIFGFQASQGAGEQVYETFTGRFTDSTTWYFIGGSAVALLGVVLLFVRRGHQR